MKNTLWTRIFFYGVIPFFLVFGISSAFIVRSVLRDKTAQAELEVRNLARFNELSLRSYIETIKLSVMIAAVQLEDIDPNRRGARELGENVILASFENQVVFNSWLVFEPNAFDGRDAAHKGEYPGETSGRFMRSFYRSGNGYAVSPDMDEKSLYDMTVSYWYIIPRLTRKLYININSHLNLVWDYGSGDGPLSALSIVSPVFRDGKVIGCVGQDILLNDIVLGPEIVPGAISALFSRNGAVRYSRDPAVTGKSLEELEFADSAAIRHAFAFKEELFQSDVYCPLMGTPAFTIFVPIDLTDFGEAAYIYAAMPKSIVQNALYSIIRPVLASLIIALAVFLVLFFHLSRNILKPIQGLTQASEAISQGNFDVDIAMSRSRDEIGIMTQSLRRMVDQFRLYIAMQRRSGEILDVYIRLYRALYKNDRLEDVFDEVVAVISDLFKLTRASLVVSDGGNARLLAVYERGGGLRKEDAGEEYRHHGQILALLSGRKYISLNAAALVEQKITFADKNTLFLFILPLLAEDGPRGYVIIEGDHETGPLAHSDAALLFMSETISYMIADREARRNPAPEEEPEDAGPPPAEAKPLEDTLSILESARAIEGLNVDKGVFLIGGSGEQYGALLRISARVFAEGVQKMRGFYQDDIPAFAIEVHGMKGALYTIGADGLGDEAKALELAAKGGDAVYCTEGYPPFAEKLKGLAEKLFAVTDRPEAASRGDGSPRELEAALRDALEAVGQYNSAGAGKTISSLLEYSWAPPVAEALKKINEALENIDYDEAKGLISGLLEDPVIREPWGEAPS